MRFSKYHGLGNDYLVVDARESARALSKEEIYRICDRNYGIGSDGILFGPLLKENGIFGLRIFNPDGSEAEKSGNGLRIFSRYLWDQGLVKDTPFLIEVPGGIVSARVFSEGKMVEVEMGKVSFDAEKIPVKGEVGECLEKKLTAGDQTFLYSAASVGNPHCVIFVDALTADLAKIYGPLIEHDPRFPQRTNVQFAKVLSPSLLQLEIWERGAGYTLASGSSSTAAAAVAYRLGKCAAKVQVQMPGGELSLSFSKDFSATMTGPVVAIGKGEIFPEAFF